MWVVCWQHASWAAETSSNHKNVCPRLCFPTFFYCFTPLTLFVMPLQFYSNLFSLSLHLYLSLLSTNKQNFSFSSSNFTSVSRYNSAAPNVIFKLNFLNVVEVVEANIFCRLEIEIAFLWYCFKKIKILVLMTDTRKFLLFTTFFFTLQN